jgi:hypothetical protein
MNHLDLGRRAFQEVRGTVIIPPFLPATSVSSSGQQQFYHQSVIGIGCPIVLTALHSVTATCTALAENLLLHMLLR